MYRNLDEIFAGEYEVAPAEMAAPELDGLRGLRMKRSKTDTGKKLYLENGIKSVQVYM